MGVTVSPFSYRLRLIWPWPHQWWVITNWLVIKVLIQKLVWFSRGKPVIYRNPDQSELSSELSGRVHAQQSEEMIRPDLSNQVQNSLRLWLDELILTVTPIPDGLSVMTWHADFYDPGTMMSRLNSQFENAHNIFMLTNFPFQKRRTDSVNHADSEDIKILIQFPGKSIWKILEIFLKLRGLRPYA